LCSQCDILGKNTIEQNSYNVAVLTQPYLRSKKLVDKSCDSPSFVYLLIMTVAYLLH